MDMKNRAAVIVNADVSPGPAIAERLARAGAHLALHASQGDKRLGWAADLPRQPEQVVTTHQAAPGDSSSAKALFEAVRARHDAVDVLVYVAKPKEAGMLRAIDPADFVADFEEDLKGLFRCAKEVTKGMVARRSGKIIPVYFGVGVRGEGELASWSACSGGIAGFVKCLAMELIRYRVQVNGVAYGVVEEVDVPFMLKRTLKQYLTFLKIPRSGSADDVAGAVHFLASSEADYVTGQNLHVNGGLLL